MAEWLKLWANAWQHPKVAVRLKSDAERVAWYTALQVARQVSGRFESEAHFRLVMPDEYAKHLGALERAGLLDRHADGSLTMHDFDTRQAPSDSTAAKRARAYRRRRKEALPQVDNDVDNVTDNAVPSRRNRHGTVTRDDHGAEQNRVEPTLALSKDVPEEDEVVPIFGIEPSQAPYSVAKVLHERFRYRQVSDEQWDLLWSLIDNEWPVGTKKGADRHASWRKAARFMERLTRDAGDPIEALRTTVERRIAARRTAAEERERSDRKDARKRENGESIDESDPKAASRRKAVQDFADGLGSPSP